MTRSPSVYFRFALSVALIKRHFIEGGERCLSINTRTFCSGGETMSCRRHENVEGSLGRNNDVIVCGDVSTASNHVIYFGGDVQDYREKMVNHRDNKRYSHWNLENTAVMLSKRFHESAVFVIKPCRMHLNTFSVYSNFVESCNDFGNPTVLEPGRSWQHLELLYKNVLELEHPSDVSPTNSVTLRLIGFSKGCIVLNQLLVDLQATLCDSGRKAFIDQIEEYYWLDGGHSGGSNTWVCDTDTLQTFSELGKKINVHVSPYQVKDPMRAWVGKEERKFVNKLRKFGAPVSETLHFDDMPASIENHFGVLEVFHIEKS